MNQVVMTTEEMTNVVGGADFITDYLVENNVPFGDSIGPVAFNGAVFATRTLPNKAVEVTGTVVGAINDAANTVGGAVVDGVSGAYNWVTSWF